MSKSWINTLPPPILATFHRAFAMFVNNPSVRSRAGSRLKGRGSVSAGGRYSLRIAQTEANPGAVLVVSHSPRMTALEEAYWLGQRRLMADRSQTHLGKR